MPVWVREGTLFGGGREQDWNGRIEKIQPDVEVSSVQVAFFSFSGLGMASSELLRHRKLIAAAAEAGRRDFLLCGMCQLLWYSTGR